MYSIRGYIFGESADAQSSESSINREENKETGISIDNEVEYDDDNYDTTNLSTPLLEYQEEDNTSVSGSTLSTKMSYNEERRKVIVNNELEEGEEVNNDNNGYLKYLSSKTIKKKKGQATAQELKPFIPTNDELEELRHRPADIMTEERENNIRMLDRKGKYHQSRGKWSGVKRNRTNMDSITNIRDDWFHTLLYFSTLYLFFILFVVYFVVVVLFGLCYYFVSRNPNDHAFGDEKCGMDVHDFIGALYFSLSTMMGVNYDGSSEYTFSDCWINFLITFIQSFLGMIFTAIVVGLAFFRLSNGQKRSRTIIFSDLAVIRRVMGQLYLTFRLAELRKHHLIDARVRVYCVRHDRLAMNSLLGEPQIKTFFFQVHPLQLNYPSDDRGGNLLMSLPSLVIHKIDNDSPIMPSSVWYDAQGWGHRCKISSRKEQSEDDTNTSSPTDNNDKNKNKNNTLFSPEDLLKATYHSDEEQITAFFKDREVEIIVCVEGVDELSGLPLQSRHSYRCEDILWNYEFDDCVSRNGNNTDYGACVIDFNKFHDVIPCPLDCDCDPIINTIDVP